MTLNIGGEEEEEEEEERKAPGCCMPDVKFHQIKRARSAVTVCRQSGMQSASRDPGCDPPGSLPVAKRNFYSLIQPGLLERKHHGVIIGDVPFATTRDRRLFAVESWGKPPHLVPFVGGAVDPVVKVVLWSRGTHPTKDEARLEQTPYPFQLH